VISGFDLMTLNIELRVAWRVFKLLLLPTTNAARRGVLRATQFFMFAFLDFALPKSSSSKLIASWPLFVNPLSAVVL